MQNQANTRMLKEHWVVQHKPQVYWNMLQTAETVAKRYGIPRQAQDEYGVQSQLRAAAAQEAGRFQAEIVPFTTLMAVADKNAGTIGTAEVTLTADEGIRPDTTYEGVAKIRPAMPRWRDCRGQRQPIFRRRIHVHRHGCQAGREEGPARPWGYFVASRSQAASRTRWGSGRCSPCRSSWPRQG